MSEQGDLTPKTRSAGQVLFVGVALILSLVLLAALRTQTVWIDDAKSFAAQPRFWPAVAILTMVLTLAAHFWQMRRRRPNRLDLVEVRRWAEPLEYALWFMVYVFAVPWVGFLSMSLAFAVGLTWRLGYRGAGWLWLAALFAVAVVVLFKGFLGVKIPGAALYEFLPGGLRSFAILYL